MAILSILFDVVGPVFLVALVGYVWARRGLPFDPHFIALIVTSVATPCLVVDSLLAAPLEATALGRMALGASLCLGLALLLGFGVLRSTRQPTARYLPALVFSNVGNIGLPLTLFAFGPPGVPLAIAYYTLASLANFTIGQAIASRSMRLGDVARTPLIWATLLALGVSATGAHLPPIAARAVHILAGITVPLMLVSLGYSLARLKITSLSRSVVFALVRLVGGFAIGWGVATLLGLEGVARGVLITQSAMPSAVYNYMFAARFDNGAEEVAGVVVLSTLLSLVLLPLFLLTLR